eukprot:154860-Karenia_brevis.AAC.1
MALPELAGGAEAVVTVQGVGSMQLNGPVLPAMEEVVGGNWRCASKCSRRTIFWRAPLVGRQLA